MAAGKLDQTVKEQQPRRQLPRRGSNSLPEAEAALHAPTIVLRVTKPPRPAQQQQEQHDVAQPEAQNLEPQRASKRLRASKTNSANSSDTAQRDVTAAGTSSAAVSRRGSPAAAAAAATPVSQQCGLAVPASGATSGVSAAASTAGMSAFEAARAARIANNAARLAALKLPELAANLAASVPVKRKAAAPTQRGVGGKRKRSEQQLPLRQSARTRGQAPDLSTAGGIDHEGRGGRIVLATALHHLPIHTAAAAAAAAAAAGSSDAAAAAAAAAALLTAPKPFKSSNGDEGADAAFLALLKSQASAVAESSSHTSAAAAVTGHQLSRMSLSAVDVAKMTRDGVSCLAFHPGTDKLIIAAADKQGKVGLWDIDHKQEQQQQDAEDSSSSYDGVLMFAPHDDYVSSLKWCQGGRKLMTGSYDGTVRLLDVETGVFDVVSGFPPGVADDGWSAGEAAAEGAVMFLATSDGHMTCHDTRQPDSSSTWVIANRKVNTLHLHSNQHHLASSASDGTVAIWDVRQLGSPAAAAPAANLKPRVANAVCKVQHQKSSQGAYWCPDGSCRLLSISFDDTLRIWRDPAGKAHMQQALSIRHNNNTGRWVIPFRPAWSPAGDAVVVGDLKRGVALFDSSDGKQLALLQAEALTAIPSRMALHPSRQVAMLAAATSSGRVHIWR